ncbi:O-succinylbenzoate synthase [Mycobacterium sp. MYCO198283]|uniref:enolase C-terminal domain-like protein n=1 Tax=Mycobacterium sp. MYCO198283 TaxID=2883505 RepID=UPI001E4F5BB7|nr:enolase C-terminal domain-like protein [Mycobacterium sp. MYCO198283]MCG5432062.1 O-succinylbenzoate synthase [Mycobacterium sp. MYCO198283]
MEALIDFDGAPVIAIPAAGGFLHEAMLLEGPQGWGEFAPPPDADDQAAARRLTAAMEGGTVGWPDPRRGRVPVAAVITATDPAAAASQLAGCRAADVRVGAGGDDAARLAAVRTTLGPTGTIRCDAGGAWDVRTAAAVIPRLAAAAGGVEFVTRPCRTTTETAELRRRIDVPIALPAAVATTDTADVAVLDGAAAGGVRRSLRLAERSALPCAVAAGPSTSIGVASALALAGALPAMPFACSLHRLAADVVSAGRVLWPTAGTLPVAPGPPAPDPAAVARYAVTDPQRLAWWRDRLRRARSARSR